jgi:glycerol kinase
MCKKLEADGLADVIKQKTGLELDAYFSATKITWILDNVKGARDLAKKGELAFGTVDSWLIWNLTEGAEHLTDITNASRTLLFNIHEQKWDEELLKIFNIPESILPEVYPNDEIFGITSGKLISAKIPICGVLGDQQAAMFGQLCVDKGMVKNTYGTGCFIMVNTGNKPVESKNKLITTIAWKINDEPIYALEGSVFVAGAVVQWLRDKLGIIRNSNEIEAIASKVSDSGGVYFVPAFTGMGAPYWDQNARGMIHGITRGTDYRHIARAALESIAYQSYDVIKAMEKDIGKPIKNIRADGGASANNLLLQFQSDVLQTKLERPEILETTALGAAYMAGLNIGFWNSVKDIKSQWKLDKRFKPKRSQSEIKVLINGWKDAINRVLIT